MIAVRDAFPVSQGHTLVVPRRHVATLAETTDAEREALWEAVAEAKRILDREFSPDGYNLGINEGIAAGQTVMHLHIHVVPRFRGDVDDPAGGVRFVIPAYGNYRSPGKLPRPAKPAPSWASRAQALDHRLVTGGEDRFSTHLRDALRRAHSVDVVAAFVQASGVNELAYAIEQALDRGTQFRVLTGDYLHITQAHALRRLLDWIELSDDLAEPGQFLVRVVQTQDIGGRSFHPKSWRFESDGEGIAWVGSSNWSHMALTRGIEWNLRIQRSTDPSAYAEVVSAFEGLWADATPLTEAWLEDYETRSKSQERQLILGDSEDMGAEGPFEPMGVQPKALEALQESRAQGRRRALVVLATGLGKTFLAAFDVQAEAERIGRMPRVLFVAHRRELLIQAAKTFRKVFPEASIGFFVGGQGRLDAEIVFASVQKLAVTPQLASLAPDRFDYVIIDECHHAAAPSYRGVLKQLDPGFLLGLTATPERADQGDVAGLFDDHVAFRADLGEGISLGRLVPFHYAGLPDTIAFEALPWSRYTVEQLQGLAETEARMERLVAAWQEFPGSRTLVFCVNIHHAEFVTEWLSNKDVRIVACHSGPESADREESLRQLGEEKLDAIASVDLFNEGIDVPSVDRVIMLRPTASPVVFLQQLGRGLRVAKGKERLQVIDFIGNHKVFLNKVRTLLSLAPQKHSTRAFLEQGTGEIELPKGCRVNVDLEVIEMLRKFLPSGSGNETVRMYRELREARDAEDPRPAAGELVRRGLNPCTVQSDSWFAFVADEGDLSSEELAAWKHGGEWFRHLEVTQMSKSFKMVLLQVLLDEDALFDGLPIPELAVHCHEALSRDPVLRRDVVGVEAFAAGPQASEWRSYWKKNPVAAWKKGKWFGVDQGRFRFRLGGPEAGVREAFEALTRELVDMRLATYRRRSPAVDDGASSFVCKVFSNQRDPILKLPTRGRERWPRGEVDVRTEDGRVWQFRFAKIAINVAKPIGARHNGLPDLLRSWFGPSAGRPGTDFRVRFRLSPDGWWVEPLGEVVELPPLGEVVAFPSLKAAAGAVGESRGVMGGASVRLPHGGTDRFAVRASGHSMDGGERPIRDGDWVVLSWARKRSLSEVGGRVCLVARADGEGGASFHLKRVVAEGGGVVLRSDNPLVADLDGAGADVVARAVEVVRPEELAPSRGEEVRSVAGAFGLSAEPERGVSRVDGHLFLLVDGAGSLSAPDRLALAVDDRQPSETAFVLTAKGEGWRYAGVGRWDGEAWAFPEVDFETWRALGSGRSASRRLDTVWVRAAGELVAFLEGLHKPGDELEARGKRCRFQGRTARGSVRIDHESMKERMVSATDLAWVLHAFNQYSGSAGLLDEAAVNFCRYLEGTPKGSTRWIDTGWALVLLDYALEQGFVGSVEPVAGESFRLRAEGRELDATVHVDRSVLGWSVVLEARGGKAGTAGARNGEYSQGLSALLAVLSEQEVALLDAFVDSRELSSLPVALRRLDAGEGGFPLKLGGASLEELEARFKRSMAAVGRQPGAKGSGNSTRRIRLVLDAGADLMRVLQHLAGSTH